MKNKETTYCINAQCPFTDCDRHLCRSQKQDGTVKVANLDGVCRRYINYIIEISWNETAIEILGGYIGNDCYEGYMQTACRLAVKALEKQKPKNPIDVDELDYSVLVYECPSCKGKIRGYKFCKYCYHCGQRLDWGDE